MIKVVECSPDLATDAPMQPVEQPPWQTAYPFPHLARDAIHVWCVNINVNARTIAHLHDTLEPFEQKRAMRRKLEGHRYRFIAARGLLRVLLGLYTDCVARDIRFDFGVRGKPSLQGRRDLCFNASDSGNYALFGFCERRDIGIDLEALPRRVAHERVSQKKFAPSECQTLQRQPQEERTTAFLRCWTRKEAYGKARGAGIYYPMKEVALCNNLQQQQLRVSDHEQVNVYWSVRQLQLPVQAVATVVVRGEGGFLQCYDGAELMQRLGAD